jgi:LPXTG-site transpeptidase (sortase) family protein
MANSLIAAGLGAALYSAWSLLDAAVYQDAQKIAFHRPAIVVAPPKTTPPKTIELWASPALSEKDSGIFGELRIPGVDLDVMVGEGLDKETLRRGGGHLVSSAKPGEPGNVVLLGHRDTFFRPLRDVKPGALAEIRTRSGVFRYRIETTEVVAPEDVDLDTTDASGIMLVTCYPFYLVGPSPQRFVARGRLVETGIH